MKPLIFALLLLIAAPALAEFSGDGCVIESRCFNVKRTKSFKYTLYDMCNQFGVNSYTWIRLRTCGRPYKADKMVSHWVPNCESKTGKIRNVSPGRYKFLACSMGGFEIK